MFNEQGGSGMCPKLQSPEEAVIAIYELALEVMQYHLSLFMCKKLVPKSSP